MKTLCCFSSRIINIPCVVIEGCAKSIAYEVGGKVNPKKLKNSWNAVYINEAWFLVHPYWAAMSAQGYNTGRWSIVECPDFHTDIQASSVSSKSFIVHSMVNDFFFLTDPDKFITKCFPDKAEWQLLKQPITVEQFEELPFLQPSFYHLGLALPKSSKCIVHTVDGKAEIVMRKPKLEIDEYYTFSYKLYRLRDNEDEGEYDYFHMERFVFQYCKADRAHFQLRFPPVAVGEYKLEIHCRSSEKRLVSEWICDFRIICKKGMDECVPLPVVPSIGWGVGQELDNLNITAQCPHEGLVNIDDELITDFSFVTDEFTSIHAELLHSYMSSTDMIRCVKVKPPDEDGVVLIRVKPPKEGEYALQVFAQKNNDHNGMGTTGMENVCNFLLQRTKFVEVRVCLL